MSTDLAVGDPAAAPPAPLPTYSPAQMVDALVKYRELQAALDRAMPDAIISISGHPFRRKPYWRAIAVAFNLSVEPLAERRDVQGQFIDGQDNFGWLVTYQATARNGRAAVGDGCCYAVEKAPRFKCPHPDPTRKGWALHYPAEDCPDFDPRHIWRALPATATEHFIRAFAHSRAYSRAVSNLVGFGETPAEEVDDHAARDERSARSRTRRSPRQDTAFIDDAQQQRMLERWREIGGTDETARNVWFVRQDISHISRIPRDRYDDLMGQLLIDRPGCAEPAPVDRDPRIHRALATRLDLGDAPPDDTAAAREPGQEG